MTAIRRRGSRISVMHNDSTGLALYPAISLGTENHDGKRCLRLLMRLSKGRFKIHFVVDDSALREKVQVPDDDGPLRAHWLHTGVWNELEAEMARREVEGDAP